jgi:cell division protein FtsQ
VVKVNWFYIKMSVLLLLTVFLFAFAIQRNEARTVAEVSVSFKDESAPFVTRETVNKLLIVSNEKLAGKVKENIALSEMEKRVKAHPIIKNADVYVTMGGDIGVAIEQRKPIARLSGAISFYIDESGEVMPLSQNHSAHVPLVTGATEKELSEVYKLVNFIRKDEFLAKHIIGISRSKNAEYTLKARKLGFTISLGKVEALEERFSNYKAFYQKALKDKSLDKYKTIELKYEGQVVCEKK